MKKITGFLLLAALLFTGIGCTDDWLKPDQPSKLDPDNAYTTVSGMQGLINELCKGMRGEFVGRGTNMRASYGMSDLAVNVNGSPRDFVGDLNPTSGDPKTHWDYFYKQVSYATTIVSRADRVDASQAQIDQIKSTGYFFLGYWYYRLMTTFGDVVLKLEEDTKPKLDYQTSTQRRILAELIPHLEYAVKHLPESVPAGQVNRAAGYMLLTKYYLMNGQFEDAVKSSSAVISTPGLTLMKTRFGALVGKDNPKIPNPNVMTDLFYKYNAGDPANTEKILVVQDYPGIDGGTTGSERMREYLTNWWDYQYDHAEGTSNTGTGSGKRTTIDGSTGGYGPLGPEAGLQILWTGRGIGGSKKTWYFHDQVWSDPAFERDMRHSAPNWYPMEALLYNAPDRTINGNLRKEFCSDTLRGWDCIFYNKIVVDDETRVETNFNMLGGCMDWYVYRLAEAYLMRAEALVWLGRGGDATADINEIRRRAGAGDLDRASTLDDVLDERARELYLEEFRKNELTRIAYTMALLGRDGYSLRSFGTKNWYYDRLKSTNNLFFDMEVAGHPERNFEYNRKIYRISPFHVYYPVPESAINDNKLGRINQNYGYVGYELNVPPVDIE